MAVVRWDPFREVASLQNRMNSLFQDFSRQQGGEADLLTAGFVPPVDVYEDEHKIVLKLEVPGIQESDLDIRMENNTLTVRGERKFDHEEKEENFHRIERRYGSFYRAFTLPSTVDSENVQARYENGVLRLELLRKAESKPKQIKVNIGSNAANANGQSQPKQVSGSGGQQGQQSGSQPSSQIEGNKQGERTAA